LGEIWLLFYEKNREFLPNFKSSSLFEIFLAKGKKNCIAPSSQCFLFWRNFSKFQGEKYDFNLYTGIFMEKMAQICQISKEKIPNHQILITSSSR
jgi:hypothetical protein